VAPSFYAIFDRHCNLNEDEIAQYLHMAGPRKEHFTQSAAIIRPSGRSAGQHTRDAKTGRKPAQVAAVELLVGNHQAIALVPFEQAI